MEFSQMEDAISKLMLKELKEADMPFIKADEHLLNELTSDSTPEEIQHVLQMKDRGIPHEFGKFGGSTQVVLEFPGTTVLLVYKPSWEELEIMAMDKNGESISRQAVAGGRGGFEGDTGGCRTAEDQ